MKTIICITALLAFATANASVDPEIKSLTDEVYKDLLKKTRFQPEKRKALVNEALENPEVIMKLMTPEQIRKLKSIAMKASTQKK